MSDEVTHASVPSTEDPHGELTAREFRASGLMQEVNRLYLHPMGYALGVRFRTPHGTDLTDDGVLFVGTTADEEGFVFEGFEEHEVERGHELAQRFRSQTAKREYNLGFPSGIQHAAHAHGWHDEFWCPGR